MKLLRLILLLFICLVLVACGHLEVIPTDTTKAPEAGKRAGEPADASVHAELRRRLAAGEYLKALRLIDRQKRQGAAESDFTGEYPGAINGLLQQARYHNAQNRPHLAGKDFRQALEFYPSDPLSAGKVDMAAARIEEAVRECSDTLMDQGLIAYRRGRLGEAIDVWKSILSFSPSHQPALKAIRTAKTQLENLEALGATTRN